jgi:diketogulonate reductase-like aldo/keto reductase
MEELQKEGKAKEIGVSNYRIEDLKETMKTAKVRIHPIEKRKTVQLCRVFDVDGVSSG